MSEDRYDPQDDDDMPYDIVGNPDEKTLELLKELVRAAKKMTWFTAYVLHTEGSQQAEFNELDKAKEFCESYPNLIAYKVINQTTNEILVDTGYDLERTKWNDAWANNFLSTLDHITPSWKPMIKNDEDDDDEELGVLA